MGAMANQSDTSPGEGMSWLDNFKPPSPGPGTKPPAYESAIAGYLGTSRDATRDESELSQAGDGYRVTDKAPVEVAQVLSVQEPSTLGESTAIANDTQTVTAKAKYSDEDFETMKSELAIHRAAAEDATAILEAMTFKNETLVQLLDEARKEKDAAIDKVYEVMAMEEDGEGDNGKQSDTTANDEETKQKLANAIAETEALKAKVETTEASLKQATHRINSLENDLSAAREIARSTGELADQSATYIAELKKKHRNTETSEKDLRKELQNYTNTAQELRSNNHKSRLEVEGLRTENQKYTVLIAQLEKRLGDAEDSVEDSKSARLMSSNAAAALEEISGKYRDAIDELEVVKRRVRDAEDAASDAELRAQDAEQSAEAVRNECAAELEREMSLLREEQNLRKFSQDRNEGDASTADTGDCDSVATWTHRAVTAEKALEETVAKLDTLQKQRVPGNEQGFGDRAVIQDEPGPMSPTAVFFSSEITKLKSELSDTNFKLQSTERALETAKLLSRSEVVESVDEIKRLRECGVRYDELNAEYQSTLRKLKIAEEEKMEFQEKVSAAESDASIVLARAKAAIDEKDLELEEWRKGGGKECQVDHNSGGNNATLDTHSRHVKSVTLKFFEAKTWDEQCAVLPVLAAVQGWDPSEIRAVDKARLLWEPTELVIADNIAKMSEMDLGVASSANTLTSSLGLGKLF